jgi:hypothetical protein
MIVNCTICTEDVNDTKIFTCKNKECNLACCIQCHQKYLIDSISQPHCLSCRNEITLDDFVKYFPKNWRLNKYKEHIKDILWSQEQSKMNETLAQIEQSVKVEEQNKLIRFYGSKIDECRTNIYYINNPNIPRPIIDDNIIITKKEPKINLYKYKCPDVECNGSLNNNYMCLICNVNYCKDCFEVITDDTKDDHECEDDKKKTVTEIKKSSRPCSGCGEMIFKLSGCFARDTKIVMWDSSIKFAQDIKVGDILIGNDGNKRTVLELYNGEDEMYEISQTNGENYIVNSKHTLALKYTGNKNIIWSNSLNAWVIRWFDNNLLINKQKQFNVTDKITIEQAQYEIEKFSETITATDIIKITADKFLQLFETKPNYKRKFMGFKSTENINWEYQKVDLDPYLLGVWLGDGTHSKPEIASDDIEIQEYLLNWCDNNDAELVHQDKFLFKIRRRNRTNFKNNLRLPVGNDSCDNCKGCSKKIAEICNIERPICIKEKPTKLTNPLTDLLIKYNLIKNKHIPKEYLLNSREVRLQLLAGIIDTDGCVPSSNKHRVIIMQTRPILSNQIIFLAKSLGFTVNFTMVEKKNIKFPGSEEYKDYKDQFCINISGKFLYEIPTILPRKKCFGTILDHSNTSISIKKIGVGNYYGWRVDENNLFVLPDMTVASNCNQVFCVLCGTAFNWNTGEIEKGVIHNPHAARYFEANPEAQERYQNQLNNLRGVGVNNNQQNICNFTQYTLSSHLGKYRIPNDIYDEFMLCWRNIYNYDNYNYNRIKINEPNNNDYRMKWLKKEVDETNFKKLCHMRYKKYQKNKMDNEIVIMTKTVLLDMLRNTVNYKSTAAITALMTNDIQKFVDYSNNELNAVGEYFNLKSRNITRSFVIFS